MNFPRQGFRKLSFDFNRHISL